MRESKAINQSIDAASLQIAEICAFANLFSNEDVAAAFAGLDAAEQATIFGALERMARSAAAALDQYAEVSHG
ncbi:hypothetical protein [Caballeronia sp. BCC1704]|uniref:hypothetical protein n=1 Tax=Caballeronia sp. BCC1704 TaxID=2676300 RepID=UPI00158BAEAB|nr:hypothetical protein [Caballeronia sp. BCC1704]